MALRSPSYLKSMIGCLRTNSSNFTTATTPNTKSFSPTFDLAADQDFKARGKKGDYVPVCMAIGMIFVSTSLGLYTAMKELRNAPNVYVKKSRRETIPEVVEPEHVLEESEKFIKKSFFRKVAHILDKTPGQVIPDPTLDDIVSRQPRAETLKDIGGDPIPR